MRDKIKIRIYGTVHLILLVSFVVVALCFIDNVKALYILTGILCVYFLTSFFSSHVVGREVKRTLEEHVDKAMAKTKNALHICGQGDATMGNREYEASWRFERALYKIEGRCCPMGGKPSCPEIAKEALEKQKKKK